MTSRIFHLPEILTLILSSLPPVQLLTSIRQVCHLWKETVESSPELKYLTWTSLSPPKSSSINNETFEVNPLALHSLSLIWKKFMRSQQHIPPANPNPGLEFEALRVYASPKKEALKNKLIRPTSSVHSVFIYAGTVDQDMHAGDFALTNPYPSLLINTLIHGVEAAKCSYQQSFTEERGFYNVVIQIFPSADTKAEKTEVLIRMQMFEPFDIESVEVKNELGRYKVGQRATMGERRSSSTDQRDPWKYMREVGHVVTWVLQRI